MNGNMTSSMSVGESPLASVSIAEHQAEVRALLDRHGIADPLLREWLLIAVRHAYVAGRVDKAAEMLNEAVGAETVSIVTH